MDNILNMQKVGLSEWGLNAQEECGISGDFTLPDYCPDVTAVLKCCLTAYVQSRQWSGEQLLVDATACARVLYLDEERKCIRCAEFSVPFSCAFRSEDLAEKGMVELTFQTKYANCRASGPRQLEIRGAVAVTARSAVCRERELASSEATEDLCVRCEQTTITTPVAATEKIITVNEMLDFPVSMPGAAMLLGGECRGVVDECKLLTGKAIVKGTLFVHHLYTSDLDVGTTHCLDFQVPFSQIMDLAGAEEGDCCTAQVQVLADTQRCVPGPDGENTVLELMAKLLIQVQVYRAQEIPLLVDAYHTAYPVTYDREEVALCTWLGCAREYTLLPIPVSLPIKGVAEVVDLWVQTMEAEAVCQDRTATVQGRLSVCVVMRDSDGLLSYYEQMEEYSLDVPCLGNKADVQITVTDCRHRLVEDTLELQVGLCVAVSSYWTKKVPVMCRLSLDTEHPYPVERLSARVYYARPGEDLWDISRECRASMDCIREENELTDTVITQPMVLLVPCQ